MLCWKLVEFPANVHKKKHPSIDFNLTQTITIVNPARASVLCFGLPEFQLGMQKGLHSLHSVQPEPKFFFVFFFSNDSPLCNNKLPLSFKRHTQGARPAKAQKNTHSSTLVYVCPRTHSIGMTKTFLQQKNQRSL